VKEHRCEWRGYGKDANRKPLGDTLSREDKWRVLCLADDDDWFLMSSNSCSVFYTNFI
jgi:hypothetical protein